MGLPARSGRHPGATRGSACAVRSIRNIRLPRPRRHRSRVHPRDQAGDAPRPERQRDAVVAAAYAWAGGPDIPRARGDVLFVGGAAPHRRQQAHVRNRDGATHTVRNRDLPGARRTRLTETTMTHIAFLRAINVGGHKPVAMADLRDLLSELGFGDPRSLLQSGNLIFDAGRFKGPDLERL